MTRALRSSTRFVAGGGRTGRQGKRSIADDKAAHRRSALLGFDGDQAVTSLPLLIRILPLGRIEEEVIVHRSLFEVVQMVVGGGAQEDTDRGRGQEFVANVEGPDGQRIVLVLVGGNRKAAVGGARGRA